MRLVIQFKTRDSSSFLLYCEPAVLWRPFQQYNINAKSKCRSPYLLDDSQPHLQNHKRRSLGRPNTLLRVTDCTISGRPRNVFMRRLQDVGMGRPLALHIEYYGDVLRTFHWMSHCNVQRTSAGDVPWHYIGDYMGMSI